MESAIGKNCKLLKAIRSASGQTHAGEQICKILNQVESLDRLMYLVQMPDGSGTTCFVFPDEVEIL